MATNFSGMTKSDIADLVLQMAVNRAPADLRFDSNKDGKITAADALAVQKGILPEGITPKLTSAENIDNLTKQILAQGTTSRWTGTGFGGPEANARAIAGTLDKAGITDIRQFGQITKSQYVDVPVTPVTAADKMIFAEPGQYYKGVNPQGRPVVFSESQVTKTADGFVAKGLPSVTETYWGNKDTGQRIDPNYNKASGNIFSGTYAGHGHTGFGVQVAPDGTPYFYTQFGGDTSSMKDIMPVVGLGLAFLAPGVGTAIGSALGATGTAAAVIGNSIVQGAISELSGGDFLDGAVQGAITAGVAPSVASSIGGSVANVISNPAISNAVTNAIASSTTSAAAAAITGGDVEKAAISGAVQGLGTSFANQVKGIEGFGGVSDEIYQGASGTAPGVGAGAGTEVFPIAPADVSVSPISADVFGTSTLPAQDLVAQINAGQIAAPTNVQKFDDGSSMAFFDDGSTLATDITGKPSYSPGTDVVSAISQDLNATGFGGAAPVESREDQIGPYERDTGRSTGESMLDLAKTAGSTIYDLAASNPLTTAAIVANVVGATAEQPQQQPVEQEAAPRTFNYRSPIEYKTPEGLRELFRASDFVYGPQTLIPQTPQPQQPQFAAPIQPPPLLGGQAPGGIAALAPAYTPVSGGQAIDIGQLSIDQIMQLQKALEGRTGRLG